LGSFGSLWDHGIVITETSHQNMNDDISISWLQWTGIVV
jgi:hypothetical protein